MDNTPALSVSIRGRDEVSRPVPGKTTNVILVNISFVGKDLIKVIVQKEERMSIVYDVSDSLEPFQTPTVITFLPSAALCLALRRILM